MLTLTDAARPKRRDEFNFETVDDEAVLYNARTEEVIYFNSAAALVWHLCDGNQSVGAIVELISNAYPEEKERVIADVRSAILDLAERKCLDLL